MKKRVTHEIPIDAEELETPPPGTGPVPDPPDRAAEPAAAPALEPQEVVGQLQRLQAEFANYRRRVERERMGTSEIAQHALVERLVPVLDDFDRAIAALEDSDSPEAEGLRLIRDKFWKVLAEAGLQRIETRGRAFDPTLHEAVATQPVEPERAEHVLEELVGGYTFRSRLVRPARVCVGVEPPKAGDDPTGR